MVQKLRTRGERILELHRAGHSYSEIRALEGFSKGLISYWVSKDVKSVIGYARLEQRRKKQQRASAKRGRATIRSNYVRECALEVRRARAEFRAFKVDAFFMFGLGLYAGDGRKEQAVELSNLDLALLRVYVRWCSKFLGVRLFSAAMWTHHVRRYACYQREVEQSVGVSLRWAHAPNKPANTNKYPRAFGTVKIRALGCHLGSLRVRTWLSMASK